MSDKEDTNKINETQEIRCFWCHKPIEIENEDQKIKIIPPGFEKDKVIVCSKEHQKRTEKFYSFGKIGLGIFWAFCFILPMILILLSFIFRSPTFLSFAFLSVGIGLLIYPSLGMNTIKGLGLRRSLILGRIFGSILIGIGIILLLLIGIVIVIP
ncbi:MAG: hypothetical protein U9O98_08385 [Asgard group archaeon]|nr:hypothetical protein [Asgard group archaeon]